MHLMNGVTSLLYITKEIVQWAALFTALHLNNLTILHQIGIEKIV